MVAVKNSTLCRINMMQGYLSLQRQEMDCIIKLRNTQHPSLLEPDIVGMLEWYVFFTSPSLAFDTEIQTSTFVHMLSIYILRSEALSIF
jgi:hypothetical protein